jgi:23S rRNA pseudouridine2605 synthase
LTNDGDFSQRIGHPKHHIPKTYEALISGHLSRERVHILRTGVDIGGYITKPAQVEIVKEGLKASLVRITIHEGKNHQVRKMFKAVGNPVIELQRISIGELRLGRLMIGHYRRLTPKELDYLKTL